MLAEIETFIFLYVIYFQSSNFSAWAVGKELDDNKPCVCVCVCVCCEPPCIHVSFELSPFQLFETLWVVTPQASLLMEFSRQKY